MTARILILDIETAPNIAYVWGAWKQNIGQKQWLTKSHILSFAAKWLGEDNIVYFENRKKNDRRIVRAVFELLDEADIVVAHNGKKFDLPTIIGRGIIHGLPPPSPYTIVDTVEVARRELRLVSNSLANLCEELGLPQKSDHKKFPGFELWLACLRGDDEAWQEMKEYNIDDVISLEALYLRLRPYMRNHPHVSRSTAREEINCPKCGSDEIQWRGYFYTRAGLSYHKFVCSECGGWGRERTTSKDTIGNSGRNAG